MEKKYEPLFTPWKIGNVEIKNRIVMCPMGGTSLFGWMKKSAFNPESANLFLDIAKNNVGLIIPGIAPIRDIMGGRWMYQNKKMFQQLKEYMNEFHKTGAKLFVQLTAGFGRSFAITNPLVPFLRNKFLGGLIKPFIDVSYICASPSELPSRWAEDTLCRELTVGEIEKMIEAFAETSKLLKEAGVDGVEVHAVHEGYLLDQFTLPYTNFRTDQYGGNFTNRYRFPVAIVQAIKEACGKDFPVSLRYSVTSKTKAFGYGAMPGEKYKEIGRDMKESEKAAKYLQKAGYDMLNADNGTYDAWYWAHPPVYMPTNCNLEDVEHIRQFVDIPVVCAGRMEPNVAAKAIKEGKIDAMGVARQFLVDQHWVTKLINEEEADIQPCICCHNGCFAMAHYKGVANDESLKEAKMMARCALNPVTMNYGRYIIKPAKNPKTVAVIGGGVGGMEAARIATLRGHKVTIYEKTDRLGGVYIAAGNFDFKERDKALLKWYIRQIEKLNIDVKFETEIKDITTLTEDEIIIATGATARNLRIEGGERCVNALSYLQGGKKSGENVVIIGGGLTGCEIAYDLYRRGKKPVIVEAKNDLMAVRGLCLANSSYLRDFFKTNNVPVHLESTVVRMDKTSVTIKAKDGKETIIPADTVIVSVGYIPNPLAEAGKRVHLVGDCNGVGNLRTVVWRAWEVAEEI